MSSEKKYSVYWKDPLGNIDFSAAQTKASAEVALKKIQEKLPNWESWIVDLSDSANKYEPDLSNTFVIPKDECEAAWIRYTHKSEEVPDAFKYAFVQGWLCAKDKNPDKYTGALV